MDAGSVGFLVASSKIEDGARSPCSGGGVAAWGLRLRKSGDSGSINLGSFFWPKIRSRKVRR